MKMEEWKECKLGDFFELHRGYDLTKSEIQNGPYPVVCSTSIMGYHNEYKVKAPGVVIGRSGTLGEVQYIDKDFWPHNTSLFVSNFKGNSPKFIKYFLQLFGTGNVGGGSAVPTLNRNHLQALTVRVPPLSTQQKIAAILSSLDDKIELNNKINTNLEQQAGALFKNWFVDFEPFGGKMPEGWKVGKLSEIGTIVGGSTPSKAKKDYYTNNGIAWITPKDLSNDKSKFISHGETDITELGFENSSAIKMPKGTVLYSSRAPIGYIAIAKNEVTTNQGFKSVIPNPNVGNAYIYYFLKSNFELIDNMASGSTFKEISGTAMKNIPVVIPDNKNLLAFQSYCNSLFDEQEKLEEENRTLSALRNTLLPKLMSGEIEVDTVAV